MAKDSKEGPKKGGKKEAKARQTAPAKKPVPTPVVYGCAYCEYTHTDQKKVQGHQVGAHGYSGSGRGSGQSGPDPSAPPDLGSDLRNLDQASKGMSLRAKIQELLRKEGIAGSQEDVTIRDVKEILSLRALAQNPGNSDGGLAREVRELRESLHSQQMAVLQEEIEGLKTGGRTPTALDLEMQQARQQGESQATVMNEGVHVLAKSVDRFGGRLDDVLRLLLSHLGPKQPGVAIHPSYTPEQYAELERALGEGEVVGPAPSWVENPAELAAVAGEREEKVLPEDVPPVEDLEPGPDLAEVAGSEPEEEPPPSFPGSVLDWRQLAPDVRETYLEGGD